MYIINNVKDVVIVSHKQQQHHTHTLFLVGKRADAVGRERMQVDPEYVLRGCIEIPAPHDENTNIFDHSPCTLTHTDSH